MVRQQDTGVRPPDGAANAKATKQKGGPLGGTHPAAATNEAAAVEAQQAQRCPRCDSLNTKFCYYNNYSLMQPRHFCKNCRRYWTKGGALRNVPVGGGCRKNKRLKHRDPSCLATLADIDASGPSSVLSSMGIPGFAPSTSSLIQELANEGHRLAFSRLNGMQRFMTDGDHHQQHPASSTTQDFFTLGGSPPALGAFDPSFPGLTYSKGDSQPLLFHTNHASDQFTPSFFDSINSPSALTPTLDHLSSFTAGTPMAAQHHVSTTPFSNTANMDAAQIGLMHHIPMNGMQVSHEEQQTMQASSGGGSFNEEEATTEMSLRRSKGKPIGSSLSEWGQDLQGLAPAAANASSNGAEGCFFVPPQLGAAADNGLWNASWPEMHAALAGSAGAMLH